MKKVLMKRLLAILISGLTVTSVINHVLIADNSENVNELEVATKSFLQDKNIKIEDKTFVNVSDLFKEGYIDSTSYNINDLITVDSNYNIVSVNALMNKSNAGLLGTAGVVVQPVLTYDVYYSTENLTNENVKVDIIFREDIKPVSNNGWVLSSNNRVLTKIYEKNEVESLIVTNVLETSSDTIDIIIDNIDKTPPEVINLIPNKAYNTDVLILFKDENNPKAYLDGVEITNEFKVSEEKDTDYVLTVVDEALNSVVINFSIDKTAPVIDNLKNNEYYNGDVILSFNEGIAYLNDEIVYNGYSIEKDGKYELKIIDEALNENKIVFYVDKEIPTAKIEANITSLTKEDVILTFIPSEEIVILDENSNWVKFEETNNYTLTVSKNEEIVVNFKDLAGNEGTASINIDYIDKDAPTGEIKASIDSLTKEDVILTLIPSEEIVILDENSNWVKTEDKNEYTLTVTENGEYVVNYKDLVGNTGVSSITIENIDKEKPSANIEANITSLTNKDVVLTLIPSEEIIIKDKNTPWEKVEGTNNYTLTIKENGTFTVNFKDLANNTGTASISIDYIDKEAPSAELKANIDSLTKEDVVLTLIPSEEIVILDENSNWLKVEDKNEYTLTVTKNEKIDVNYKDLAGNIGTASINIDYIDKEAPSAEIKANIESLTKEDVILTLIPSEEIIILDENSNWIKTVDKNEYTLNISKNGEYVVNYKDLAGNTGVSSITVENIDKEKPSAKIEANITSLTNKDVVLTLIPSEEIIIKDKNTPWEKVEGTNNYTLTVKENGTFTVNFKDLANNTGSASISIDYIDKEAPTAELKANIDSLTKEDVILTFIPNEEIVILDENSNWVKVEDKNEYTLTVTKNEKIDVNYKDLAGNTGTASINIDYIDKEAPTAKIEANIKEATKEDVILTLIPSEEIIILDENSNWIKTENKNEYTLTVGENAEIVVNYKDLAGNTGVSSITVENIDKEKPIATIEANIKEATKEDVVLTLIPSEEIVILDENSKWEKVAGTNNYTLTVSKNDNYKVNFKDLAGNENNVNIKIDYIDKEAPSAELKTSIESLTKQDIVLTLIPSEEIIILDENNSWVKTEDKNEYTLTISKNGEYVVNYKDLVGNIGTSSITIENIDKEKPSANIEANITSLTNKDVVLTLIPSEEIIIKDKNTPWEKVEGSNNYTLTIKENGTFTVNFKDLANNTGSTSISIDYIDKEAPSAELKANIDSLTKEDVILTLIPSEEIVILDENSNWLKVEDKNEYTLTVTKNEKIVVNYKDLAGNTGTASINIDYIDKEAPTAKIEANIKEATKEDVILTLIPSEEIIILDENSNWVKTEGKNEYTLTIKENGEVIVNFKDLAGNNGSSSINIDYIDKIAPTGEITANITALTNKSIILTFKPNEEVKIIGENSPWKKVEGKNEYTRTIKSNGNFKVSFEDLVGNVGKAELKIENVDLKVPTAKIEANIKEATKEDVILTLIPSEEIIILDENSNWVKTEGKNEYTLTIKENGEVIVNFKDLAG
ncbi:MAG: hypothetical protein E7172_02540, partial [Firmicutes bacterium]|nr:hypothetical protein [Bacillota bacterium]